MHTSSIMRIPLRFLEVFVPIAEDVQVDDVLVDIRCGAVDLFCLRIFSHIGCEIITDLSFRALLYML